MTLLNLLHTSNNSILFPKVIPLQTAWWINSSVCITLQNEIYGKSPDKITSEIFIKCRINPLKSVEGVKYFEPAAKRNSAAFGLSSLKTKLSILFYFLMELKRWKDTEKKSFFLFICWMKQRAAHKQTHLISDLTSLEPIDWLLP